MLNASERARLRLFLLSPYFNNRGNAAEMLRLFDLILTCHVDEAHPELSKKAVSQAFFPAKPFVEGQKGPVDTLTSELFNLIKRFMAQSAFEENDLAFEEGLAMAKFYRRYDLEERFWQTIKVLQKEQDDSPFKDANYFQKQFFLDKEAGTFESLTNRFEDDVNLKTAIKNLDVSYAINKIELLCLLMYQQKLTRSVIFDFEATLSQAVLQLPEEYPTVPQYQLNQLAFQLIQEPDQDAVFSTFEALLEKHKTEIPFDKIRNLKAYYRSFWNRRYAKSGSIEVRQQMFQVYKEHYEQGYFYEGNAVMINSLKVLILFGLRLKQFDWVKKVLDEHPPARICGTKHPVEAHSLCVAEYYFYLKDYPTALETLIYKHFENPNYSLWAEMLLVKIYFETSDELLEYRMKALDQKVRRTKLSAEAKNRYYLFLQKLDKIIKYGWGKDNPKRTRLLQEIKTTPGIPDREWLLEKLGEDA